MTSGWRETPTPNILRENSRTACVSFTHPSGATIREPRISRMTRIRQEIGLAFFSRCIRATSRTSLQTACQFFLTLFATGSRGHFFFVSFVYFVVPDAFRCGGAKRSRAGKSAVKTKILDQETPLDHQHRLLSRG